MKRNKKGFTLVELIVVVAIMAVLAGTVAGVVVSTQNNSKNSISSSGAETFAKQLKVVFDNELLHSTTDYFTMADNVPTFKSDAVINLVKTDAFFADAYSANQTKGGQNKYYVYVAEDLHTVVVTYQTLGSSDKYPNVMTITYNSSNNTFDVVKSND